MNNKSSVERAREGTQYRVLINMSSPRALTCEQYDAVNMLEMIEEQIEAIELEDVRIDEMIVTATDERNAKRNEVFHCRRCERCNSVHTLDYDCAD